MFSVFNVTNIMSAS